MSCQDHLSRYASTRSRRWFFEQCGVGLGAAALGHLLANRATPRRSAGAEARTSRPKPSTSSFSSWRGAPSHLELFDYKPQLAKFDGTLPPAGIAEGLSRGLHQSQFQAARAEVQVPPLRQERHRAVANCCPTGEIVDDIAIVKSMVTDAFNHAPGQLLMNTGTMQFGRPSMGAWVLYGLGLGDARTCRASWCSVPAARDRAAAIAAGAAASCPRSIRACNSAAAAIRCCTSRTRPAVDRELQRDSLDALKQLNQIAARCHRRSRDRDAHQLLRDGVPDASRRAGADGHRARSRRRRWRLYGAEPGKASFANNCLLARRLVEKGVRFVQFYHEAWDQHSNLVKDLQKNCLATDRASAALIKDLKQRGLLDDTLVIWGGEFGRTPMVQGGSDGRDHHPNAFTMWMAGGGIKAGARIGETDELGFNVVKDRVHVHDLHATMLPSARLRSQAADLPVPGPPVPPDRRGRQRGGCADGLVASAICSRTYNSGSTCLALDKYSQIKST